MPNLTSLSHRTAHGGGDTYARPPVTYVTNHVLAAATRESITVPAGAKVAIFSATADFFAKADDGSSNVAVPGSDVTDGTGQELNPTVWDVENVDTIGIIASATPTLSICWYGGE